MGDDRKREYAWPDGSIRDSPPPPTAAAPLNDSQGPRRVTREARRRIKGAQLERARRGGRYR